LIFRSSDSSVFDRQFFLKYISFFCEAIKKQYFCKREDRNALMKHHKKRREGRCFMKKTDWPDF